MPTLTLTEIQTEVDARDKESKTKELLLLRLQGEVGELFNYITKEIMRGENHKDKIMSELPDILFYLTRIVNYYGFSWDEIWKIKMAYNSAKYGYGYPE